MILKHSVRITQDVAAVWKLKENPTYGADLAHWTIIFGPVTTLVKSPILQQEEFNVKTLPR